jgi:hypothetical protein
MEYEITHKSGKKEIVDRANLPYLSPNFNRMIKELSIGQSMYDITTMTDVKRIK